jgi:hypothetical protein
MQRKVYPGPRRQKNPGPKVVAKIFKNQMNPGPGIRQMIPGPELKKTDEPRARNLAGDSWAPAEKADEPRARNLAGDSWAPAEKGR